MNKEAIKGAHNRTPKPRLTDAQRRIAEDNLALVHWYLARNPRYVEHFGYDDAFQIGCLGLMKAARNFDPARGTFATIGVMEMQHALGSVLRREACKKRRPQGEVISLDARCAASGLADGVAAPSILADREPCAAKQHHQPHVNLASESQSIIITSNAGSKITLARHGRANGTKIAEARAECAHDDKYDFATGAMVALWCR